MRRMKLICAWMMIVLMSLLIFSCGKDEIAEPDIEQNFVGRWWLENRYDNESGQKIVERISITFYDPAGSYTQGYSALTSSSEFYSYKWTMTVTIDGVEDDDLTYDEAGEFICTDTQITMTPFDGTARVYTYEMTSTSDSRVMLTDSQGNVLDFEYKNPTW